MSRMEEGGSERLLTSVVANESSPPSTAGLRQLLRPARSAPLSLFCPPPPPTPPPRTDPRPTLSLSHGQARARRGRGAGSRHHRRCGRHHALPRHHPHPYPRPDPSQRHDATRHAGGLGRALHGRHARRLLFPRRQRRQRVKVRRLHPGRRRMPQQARLRPLVRVAWRQQQPVASYEECEGRPRRPRGDGHGL